MSSIVKARYSVLHEYWLTDDGILRVKVFRLTFPYYAIPAVWLVIFDVLSSYVELTGYLSYSGLLGFLISVAVSATLIQRKKEKFSTMSVEQVRRDHGLSELFPWSDVTDAFLRADGFTFWTKQNEYSVSFLDKSDRERALELLRAKIGERLRVK